MTKISLHFAVGDKGEFGNGKLLPWNSYGLELDFFWHSMRAVDDRVIILGKKSWEALPDPVKGYLYKLTGGRLEVISSENLVEDVIAKYPDSNLACIGGAFLLERIMNEYTVDRIFYSEVSSNGEPLVADVFLDKSLIEMVISKFNLVKLKEYNLDESPQGIYATSYEYGEEQ